MFYIFTSLIKYVKQWLLSWILWPESEFNTVIYLVITEWDRGSDTVPFTTEMFNKQCPIVTQQIDTGNSIEKSLTSFRRCCASREVSKMSPYSVVTVKEIRMLNSSTPSIQFCFNFSWQLNYALWVLKVSDSDGLNEVVASGNFKRHWPNKQIILLFRAVHVTRPAVPSTVNDYQWLNLKCNNTWQRIPNP